MLLDLASHLAALAAPLTSALAALLATPLAPLAAPLAALATPLAALASMLATPLAALASPLAAGLAAAAVMAASAKRARADAREPDLGALERDVANGDAEAEYRLSMILKEGILTERDLEGSTALLLGAARQEHPAAMLELSNRYRDGEGLPRDLALAARWRALAEDAGDGGVSGSPDSGPPRLTRKEFESLMVSAGVDVEKLARRFIESSETGRPVDLGTVLTPEKLEAMRALYLEARDPGEPDSEIGFEARRLKSAQKPSPARSNPRERSELEEKLRRNGVDELEMRLALANAYTLGEGVEVDLDEAFRQNRLAAELGYEPASLNLGMMLFSGIGTLSDIEEATPLLRRGLSLGVPQAPFYLWQISCRRPDLVSPDEGLEFLKRAAGMGLPAALAALAAGPPTGDVERLVQAARRGDIEAVYLLADRCRQGPPEERDQAKAVILYKRAAEMGHLKAARTLERIHRIGVGTPADEREADKWRRVGDRIERDMARREESVKKAAKKPAGKAAKNPARIADKKPTKKPAKKPLEKLAKKTKTASGKKPREK
jgi:TPR repeat protein